MRDANDSLTACPFLGVLSRNIEGVETTCPLRRRFDARTCARVHVCLHPLLDVLFAHALVPRGYIRGRLVILTHIQSHLLKTCASPGKQETRSVEFALQQCTWFGRTPFPSCSFSLSLAHSHLARLQS